MSVRRNHYSYSAGVRLVLVSHLLPSEAKAIGAVRGYWTLHNMALGLTKD